MGKLEEVKRKMERNEIAISDLCCTRWKRKAEFYSDNFGVIHSGVEERGRGRVEMIHRGEWGNKVCNTYHVNKRLMIIILGTKPIGTVIVQVYFPTSKADNDEIEEMYKEIGKLLMIRWIKGNLLIVGSLNQ